MHARAATLCLVLLLGALAPLALAGHEPGSPRSLGGGTVPQTETMLRLEAEDFADKQVGALVQDARATGGSAWRMDRYGVIATPITLHEAGVVTVLVRARGEHPPGMMIPHMHPNLDGLQRGEWDVGSDWLVYRQTIPMTAGEHVLEVDNFNNYHAPADDRTLVVDWVELLAPTLEGAPRVGEDASVTVDGPDIHAAGTGLAQPDDTAREGTTWFMWGVGCFVEAVVFDHAGDYELTARLRGNERLGEGSHVTVRLDGETIDEYHVGDDWEERTTPLRAPGGASVLEICYDNDYGGDEKRNLWLDDMRIDRIGDAPPGDAPPDATDPDAQTPEDQTDAGTPPDTSDAPPPDESTQDVTRGGSGVSGLALVGTVLALALAARLRRA